MTPDSARAICRGSSGVLLASTHAALAGGGCQVVPRSDGAFGVREITPPFLLAAEASDPAIVADAGGHIALTWVSRDSTGANLWLSVSRDSGATFGAPVRVNLAAGRVVSFAESRPIAALGPGG